MTQTSRFTERCVVIVQGLLTMETNPPLPNGGGGFVDYAFVSLHCLRIHLDTSYHMTIDLLKEMLQITGKIGPDTADPSAPSTLCEALGRIETSLCRVLTAHHRRDRGTAPVPRRLCTSGTRGHPPRRPPYLYSPSR